MDLPAGLTSRPLTPDDAAAVTAVIAQSELHDVGEVVIELADIVSGWGRPSFDVGDSTLGVFDGDRLIAYGEHSGGHRSDAAVLPSHRGRGIGTAVAAWIRDKARSRGAEAVGMPVPAGSDGERLLRALGYQVRWQSWVLALPEGATIPDRPLPQGYSLRTVSGDADVRAAWQVVEDAFLEWSDRERQAFDDWAATVTGRPGFQPWRLRLVVDPTGAVVGVCHVVVSDAEQQACGFIDKLAVRRDQRGRGLAQALLADAFAAARAHGAQRSELSTDSRTGALSLYERVGMLVTSRWVHLGIEL